MFVIFFVIISILVFTCLDDVLINIKKDILNNNIFDIKYIIIFKNIKNLFLITIFIMFFYLNNLFI